MTCLFRTIVYKVMWVPHYEATWRIYSMFMQAVGSPTFRSGAFRLRNLNWGVFPLTSLLIVLPTSHSHHSDKHFIIIIIIYFLGGIGVLPWHWLGLAFDGNCKLRNKSEPISLTLKSTSDQKPVKRGTFIIMNCEGSPRNLVSYTLLRKSGARHNASNLI